MGNSVEVSQKIKRRVTIWPIIPSSGCLPPKLENTYSRRHIHLCVHCSILTVTNTWKQPKCPLIHDRVKKMWYIYTTGYYSALRKDKILPWMDLENIILSRIDYAKKKSQGPYDFTHMWDIKLKTTNKQTRQTKTHRHRQQYGSYQREGVLRGWWRVEGVENMVTEALTLDGGHTMQYADDVS